MHSTNPTQIRPNYFRGVAGAIAGAAIGYAVFALLVEIGLYAMIVPGAFIGIGCSSQTEWPSLGMGVFCGVFALMLSLFIEWNFFPFVADDSFSFVLQHLSDLRTLTKVSIGAGTLAGFWFGRGK